MDEDAPPPQLLAAAATAAAAAAAGDQQPAAKASGQALIDGRTVDEHTKVNTRALKTIFPHMF